MDAKGLADYKAEVQAGVGQWKQGWSRRATTGPVYDERFGWGKGFVATGVTLWVIAVIVYIVVRSAGQDGNSFDEAASAVSGAAWGGAIFGFGSLIVLHGVIFMAGAERTH